MSRKVEAIGQELERLMDAIRDTTLGDVDYEKKVTAYERLTKIKLLLEGEATDNININVIKDKSTDELMKLAYEADGKDTNDEKPSGPGTSEERTIKEDTDTVPSV